MAEVICTYPKPKRKITLDVHVCAARTTHTVTFGTEAEAVSFIEHNSSTCAFDTEDDLSGMPLLQEALYPTCEHGLSLRLCGGPNHYYD